MTPSADDARRVLRVQIYTLLIVISAGAIVARVAAVNAIDRIELQRHLERQGRDLRLERPFLSGNDRSRWCTVRALVEQGTYAIDDIHTQPGWDTIDMVYHDGHFYSSKPPLLPTLMAAQYWVIYKLTGWSLATHAFLVGRLILLTTNVAPLVASWIVLAGLIERYGRSDWSRLFVMASATFGTFLSTFAIVINNHLIAAVSVTFALAATLRIWHLGDRRWPSFALAGLTSAFAAANELPALSFFAVVGLVLLYCSPRLALVAALPAALLVAVGFFGTNWAAHGTLVPAYAHRSADRPEQNWYDYTYERDGRVRESYWNNPVGIDRGEPSRAKYALHAFVGHHGIFSLTPLWLLSLLGMGLAWLKRERPLAELAAVVAALSLVCLAFYLGRSQQDRNYGGVTSGFRWMFWFAPLWLVTMLPAVDRAAQNRWLRGLALLALALSVFSVSFPTWNPWTHPWLYRWLAHLGWIAT